MGARSSGYGIMQSSSGILRVVRTSQFMNRWRRISVCVDGHEVGKVRHGETAEFVVDIGEHDVYAAIDWVRSETVRIGCAAGTPTMVRLSSPLRGWKLLRVQEALSGPPGSFITLEVLQDTGHDRQ